MSKKRKHKRGQTQQTQPTGTDAPAPEPAPELARESRLPAPRWLPWLFIALIAGLTFVAYHGGLDNGFTNWDDNWLITENRHIRNTDWQTIQHIFNPMAPREELGNEYLPLRDLSYSVNYALDGYNPRGYHAANILLHLFNSLLVMLLCWRVTGRRWIGGVAGILFAVHPVHVEAVAWLSSRKDLLATFFLLLSCNLYLAARRARTGLMPSESFVQRVRESTRLHYLLALFAYVCALLSKMTAVVLPALLLLLELFRGRALHSAPVARRAALLAPFWVIAGLFTLLAGRIGSGLMREPYGDSRLQSLLTAISALTRDAQVLLAGWPMHAAVDLPVQTGFSIAVLVGVVLLVAMLAAGLIGWRESNPKAEGAAGDDSWTRPQVMAWGAVGFGALWFLASLAPVSNFIVQIGTVFAERYLYIPSIGFCLAVAALGVLGAEHLRRTSAARALIAPVALLLLAAVTVACTWGTVYAVKPWRNSISLWTHALHHDPGNHVAHFNLAREYTERALVDPDDDSRRVMLQNSLVSYRSALANPARTYRNDPARVYGAMALSEIHLQNPQEALRLLEEGRKHIAQPWRDERATADIIALLANPRGLALSALGRHEEALAAFEEALAASGRYQAARINIATELSRKALSGDSIDEAALLRAKRELNEYEQNRSRDELSIEARARIALLEYDARLRASGKGSATDVPAELLPLLAEARQCYAELIAYREAGVTTRAAMAATLIEAADAHARGRAGDATAEKYLRRALQLKDDYKGLRTLLAQLLFERNDGRARIEANKLMGDELERWPDYKPALQLKAAGLRQTAANQAVSLMQTWTEEYHRAMGNKLDPTWEGLIYRFHTRTEFRKSLLVIVALLRQAIEADPENELGHGMVEGTGLPISTGMWFTGDAELRMNAEDLLRTAFNARPEDGPVGDRLTSFYLKLAEDLLQRPAKERADREFREDLDALLKNMLTLSERARQILSRKLLRVGRAIESGETRLNDADGNPMELSREARRYAASEFMRAATVLSPDNVEALDWLKKYYEEDGDLDEALKVFAQLVEALSDRPDLMHGVHLSLCQLQMDFGQQLLDAFKSKLRLHKEVEAKELRDKAVRAYLDALDTTGKLLDSPHDPDKVSLPIRIRGVACQRLAYLVTSEAEKYYTIALEAYERAPLDFKDEISEVRRKRAWFVSDPYRRLAELRLTIKEAPEGKDMSDVEEDILNLERRIARIEAEALLAQGNPEEAMKRLQPALRAPTSELYVVRGRVHQALAAKATGEEKRALLVKAAQDLVRGSEPKAVLEGGELYWQDEALALEPDRVQRARIAFMQAADVIETALPGIAVDTPQRAEYTELHARVLQRLKEMDRLGAGYLAAAKAQQREGKLLDALESARTATVLLGDYPEAYRIQGVLHRDLARQSDGPARKAYAEDAAVSFSSALALNNLLTSQRVELCLLYSDLLLQDLAKPADAREWLSRARTSAEDEAVPQFRPALLKQVLEAALRGAAALAEARNARDARQWLQLASRWVKDEPTADQTMFTARIAEIEAMLGRE